MANLLDSLAAIKDVAKLFAPLATVGADIDRIVALVAHEDELKQAIDAKVREKIQLEADITQRRAEVDSEIAEKQRIQTDVEAGYQAKRDALQVEFQTGKESARREIDAARTKVPAVVAECQRDIDELTRAAAVERQRIVNDHNAFIEQTKEHRAQIEANTKALEDKRDAVRAELAPLMKE